MTGPGQAARSVRLSVFVGERDNWRHKPVYSEIVRRARKAGLAGATVLRGIEGFGGASRIHTTQLFRLSEDLPMVILIVDDETKVRAFLPQLEELDFSGLVVLDEVETIHYGTGH